MRKLAIAVAVLMILGIGVRAAEAAPVLSWAELAFKSSADGAVWDNPYGLGLPPSGDFSAFDLATGLGSISFTFSGEGTHYVAGFFDYQFVDELAGNGLFDETANWGALAPGWSGKSNDPWALDPPDPPGIYDQFLAFDATHPFDNWAWMSPVHDVAVALGYTFDLTASDPARTVTFTVSLGEPRTGYMLRHTDEPSGQAVYFSGSIRDGGDVEPIPEPGTLTLLGLGLVAGARRLRCRR